MPELRSQIVLCRQERAHVVFEKGEPTGKMKAHAPRGTSLLMLEERSILKVLSSSMHLAVTFRPVWTKARVLP